MEEILESPKFIPDEIVISKCFVEESINSQNIAFDKLHVGFLGYDTNMIGAIRRAGNKCPHSLTLFQTNIHLDELKYFGKNGLYFYDSRIFKNNSLISELKSKGSQIYDLKVFTETKITTIDEYRKAHPPFQFGRRRIECLHETGMAGARYGFHLLKEGKIKEGKMFDKIKACVLGYGNVGMGAIHECYNQGVRAIQILGHTQTLSQNIGKFLKTLN